jgi:excisionase family DNA binding protein
MQEMQDRQERAPRLLSADEVQQLLDIDRSTIYRMAGDGRLPGVKIGRQWRFPADRIAALLEVGTQSPEHPAFDTTAAQPASPPIPTDVAESVLDVAAGALDVMMVVTDMAGRPVTNVVNPCARFVQQSSDPATLAVCVDEWRQLADDVDFESRFRAGRLGFECARAFIRVGSELVGMVLAGGVAPTGDDSDDLFQLDPGRRQQVLSTLPKVATALSRLATPTKDLRSAG